MSLDHDIRVLARVSLFAGLEAEQLRLLAFGSERRTAAGGSTIVAAGTPADGGIVVLSGAVELSPGPGRPGRAQVGGPATLVGMPGLFSESEHQFTVEARTPCVLLHLRRAVFLRLLDEYPDLARRFHADLARRIGAFAAEVAAVGGLLVPDTPRGTRDEEA